MLNSSRRILTGFWIATIVFGVATAQNAFSKDNSFASGQSIFKGVAAPITTMTVTHGFNTLYRGDIVFTAKPGTLFHGPIKNIDGKIIKKGDTLIQLATTSREEIVEIETAGLDAATAAYKLGKENYIRFKTLYAKRAVSQADFQDAESTYYTSKALMKSAELKLYLANQMLQYCTYNAEFDGIVDKVMIPTGWIAGELPVMKVSQLFPIAIEVKMDREKANLIDSTTPVCVYPPLGGDPVGINYASITLTEDGVRFVVNNYPFDTDIRLRSKDKNITIVNDITTVIPFDQNSLTSDTLGIYTDAIQKDESGNTYVWQAVGQENLSPNKGIAKEFTIKKVNIKLGNKVNQLEPGVEVVELADAGSLKMLDVLVDPVQTEALKDGQKVLLGRSRYIFMPGDPVKVEIGPISK